MSTLLIFDFWFIYLFRPSLIWIFQWLPAPRAHRQRARRIRNRKLRLILLNSTWNDTYQDELCLECVGYTPRCWFLHFHAHRCAARRQITFFRRPPPIIYVRRTFRYWCVTLDDAFHIQLTSLESRVLMCRHVLVAGRYRWEYASLLSYWGKNEVII